MMVVLPVMSRVKSNSMERPAPKPGPRPGATIDPLLLTSTQVSTFLGTQLLTRASGFFFERGDRLFLVTSRHVLFDGPSGHAPDRVEVSVHPSASNLADITTVSIPLYEARRSVWTQASDGGGEVDVAALEIPPPTLPHGAAVNAFSPANLPGPDEVVPIGAQLLLVGFPLGFHDTIYHLPVVRHAIVASAFGVRFQSQGFFLTDARAHRGSSGAPVVMACPALKGSALRWKLLGVHSSRMDMSSRDLVQDESLGLNCAWYADIIPTLTERQHTGGDR
jgi:hypothetical protein